MSRTARSTRPPPPRTSGASPPHVSARSRGRAATRPSRAARRPAPGAKPRAISWPTATRMASPRSPAASNTKYNGNYNVAAGRNAYGGWNTAVAGPYGGRVTTTLPSGYRTTTYYGRPYYYVRGRLLPAVHAPRCALLLPRARAVLRLLPQPAGGRDRGGGGGRDVPDVEGRQLQQEDHEQRRQGGLPISAPASGREHQDAPGRARARDRLGHHATT